MKRFMLLFATLLIGGVAYMNAQQSADSNIYGLWQFVEERVAPDGTTQYVGKPVFKSINKDNTYFAMVCITIDVEATEKYSAYSTTETYVTQRGEIEFRAPGNYMEYINEHFTNPDLTNTITNLRYEFKDAEKNILSIEYLTANNNSDTWSGETWIRVQSFGRK